MEPLKGHGGGINSVGGTFFALSCNTFEFHHKKQIAFTWRYLRSMSNLNWFCGRMQISLRGKAKKIAKESLYLCEGMQNNLKNIISYHH